MSSTIKTKSKNSLFISLVSVSLVLTLITVVLSAYIRLSVNGLGCTEWPDCYGRIDLGVQHKGIDVLTPSGAHMQHTGIRTLHRLVASALGVFVVVIAVMAVRRRSIPSHIGWRVPLWIFASTVFLSWLGYATPTPLVPAVTLGNLLGGMLMLALLWWLSQRSVIKAVSSPLHTTHLKPQIIIGLVLLAVQITLGAATSAWFAGPACPELMNCSGARWSMSALNIFQTLSVDSHGKILNTGSAEMIQLLHRLGAVISAAYLLWLGIRIVGYKDRLKATAITLLGLLGLQLVLGLSSIAMQLPLLMVTAHNAVAALLLLTVINLYHLLTPASAQPNGD